MSDKSRRETFDVLDEVRVSPAKNIGMAVLFHLIAVGYAVVWQLLLTN